jgi:hypothetical protein
VVAALNLVIFVIAVTETRKTTELPQFGWSMFIFVSVSTDMETGKETGTWIPGCGDVGTEIWTWKHGHEEIDVDKEAWT